MKSCIYSVSGMHCRSCELIIEKEISAMRGVKSVSASTKNSTVSITAKKLPAISLLNQTFKESGYIFSSPLSRGDARRAEGFVPDIFTSLLIVIGILVIFFLIQKTGIFSSLSITSSSILPAFFAFGLLAGFSTCAALVGGIVLSLSRQWGSLYSSSDSTFKRLQPVLMFNAGRIVFFSIFGALLGLFGTVFHLSLTATAVVTILVSVIMLALGLQMLGFRAFSSFQLALPKSLTSKLSDETQFQGKFMPFLMGGLTFFLPCGFTLTAQSLSLVSGSPLHGALIMGFFALGTFLPLFLIGYGSVKSQSNPKTASYFSQIAGILVIIFALFNLNSQLIVLGISNVGASLAEARPVQTNLPQIVSGKQILTLSVSSSGYHPDHFTVKAGVPVDWNITAVGNVGCAGTLVSRSLFPDIVYLTPGATVTKEFLPATPGIYRFSCAMGMYTGTIEVVN